MTALSPVTASTPLVKTITDGSPFELPNDIPGSFDSSAVLTAGARPQSTGPLFEAAGTNFDAAVARAHEIALSLRIGNGVFPAQAVIRDAHSGAFLITSTTGPTHYGSGTIGAIDGWGYSPTGAVRLHDDVQALVGGEIWYDFRSSANGVPAAFPH